jgi:hypothetical protein
VCVRNAVGVFLRWSCLQRHNRGVGVFSKQPMWPCFWLQQMLQMVELNYAFLTGMRLCCWHNVKQPVLKLSCIWSDVCVLLKQVVRRACIRMGCGAHQALPFCKLKASCFNSSRCAGHAAVCSSG